MNKLFTALFYISLVFLIVFLYKFDYFVIPQIGDYNSLILSFLLLFIGYLFLAQNWRDNLKIMKSNVSIKTAIVSTGLSAFMKYIPGKVMVVLGRAAYITSKNGTSLTITSSASFYNQIIILWTGLIVGNIALINAPLSKSLNILIIIFFTFLTCMIFFQKNIIQLVKIIGIKFGRNIILPEINLKDVIKILPSFFLLWVTWGLGFYFLIKSVYSIEPISFKLIFVFPLTTTLGMAALFAPGGLGVREGLIVACLSLYKIPIEVSTGIAVLSRVWFLVGEVYIFLTSLILRKYDK